MLSDNYILFVANSRKKMAIKKIHKIIKGYQDILEVLNDSSNIPDDIDQQSLWCANMAENIFTYINIAKEDFDVVTSNNLRENSEEDF